MKTFLVCILAAVISSSNGFIFSLLGGNDNQHSGQQEYQHHHHHHVHEVVHKTVHAPVEQHVLPAVNYESRPVDLQPQYVQLIRVIHEDAPPVQHGVQLDHGPVPVLTKVVQPIVNKNFYQSRHEHHYHQLQHGGPGPVGHPHHKQW